jgi:hypothetical protein
MISYRIIQFTWMSLPHQPYIIFKDRDENHHRCNQGDESVMVQGRETMFHYSSIC